MSRNLKIIFTLSLLLNIVFIGVTVGATMRIKRYFVEREQAFSQNLPPDVSHKVAKTFRETRMNMRDHYKEARAVREKMEKVLLTDPFDEKAFDRVAEEMLQMQMKLHRSKVEATKKLAKELPPDQRHIFTKRLVERAGGHPGGPFHGKPRGRAEDGVKKMPFSP